MKKALVFLIVGLVFFGACSAQNVNAHSSNDAQRVVGTWKSPGDTIFTFNADGTFTQQSDNGRYFISSGKLIIMIGTSYRIYNIYISSNGRTLFLEGSSNWWLDKQ